MAKLHSQAMFFQARAVDKVANPVLQRALQKAKPLFVGKRAKGIAALADDQLEFEQLRTTCVDIRNRVLEDLDVWLDIFEIAGQSQRCRGAVGA
jgi:L-lactate dehydrogenase complex protein LldF